jgi:hypothetical protein
MGSIRIYFYFISLNLLCSWLKSYAVILIYILQYPKDFWLLYFVAYLGIIFKSQMNVISDLLYEMNSNYFSTKFIYIVQRIFYSNTQLYIFCNRQKEKK